MKQLKLAALLLAASNSYAYTLTPNMSLKIPAVGDVDYPTSISDTFTLVDLHDHSPGKGIQIPSGGIEDNAITSGKIALGATDNSTLEVSGGVLQAKDGGITKAKLSALNISSSTCGTLSGSDYIYNNSSGTPADITNCNVTLNGLTSGRSVKISLSSSPSATQIGAFIGTAGASSFITCNFDLYRDGSIITKFVTIHPQADNQVYLIPSYEYTDTAPSSASHTYKIHLYSNGGCTCTFQNIKITAVEL